MFLNRIIALSLCLYVCAQAQQLQVAVTDPLGSLGAWGATAAPGPGESVSFQATGAPGSWVGLVFQVALKENAANRIKRNRIIGIVPSLKFVQASGSDLLGHGVGADMDASSVSALQAMGPGSLKVDPQRFASFIDGSVGISANLTIDRDAVKGYGQQVPVPSGGGPGSLVWHSEPAAWQYQNQRNGVPMHTIWTPLTWGNEASTEFDVMELFQLALARQIVEALGPVPDPIGLASELTLDITDIGAELLVQAIFVRSEIGRAILPLEPSETRGLDGIEAAGSLLLPSVEVSQAVSIDLALGTPITNDPVFTFPLYAPIEELYVAAPGEVLDFYAPALVGPAVAWFDDGMGGYLPSAIEAMGPGQAFATTTIPSGCASGAFYVTDSTGTVDLDLTPPGWIGPALVVVPAPPPLPIQE